MIIAVAGNHDLTLDRDFYPREGAKHHQPILDVNKARSYFLDNPDITYLEDSAATFGELKIWGSPWIPPIGPWAFTFKSSEHEKTIFDQIPTDTDLLVTHTPAKDIMDIFPAREFFEDPQTKEMKMRKVPGSMGSKQLLERVKAVRPKVHIFGHIHFCAGWDEIDGTVFINASIVNDDNQPVVKPKVLSLLLD